MRRILATSLILAAATVGAEELTFGDLNFLIPAKRVNLSVDAAYTTDRETTGGTRLETEGTRLNTQATVGLSEKINLYAGLGYNLNVQVDNSANKHNIDGLTNPYLGGLYRLQNQNDGSVNIDIGISGRFNLIDAEAGSGKKDGNAANGRHQSELYGRVGRKWNEANEWQLQAGVLHHYDGESEVNSSPKEELDEEASTDYYLRAAYQYRPVKEFMMTLAAQGTMVGEKDVKNKPANTKTNLDSHLDLDFDFIARYLITENFIGRFNYGVGRNPDYDGDENGVGFEVEKRRENRISLGIDWLI